MAMNMPAAAADPMTPARLGPIACINRWLVLSYFNPCTWETLAAMGTAETPAEPIRGFIFSFKKRFIILTVSNPPIVQTAKSKRPNVNMKSGFQLRKLSSLVTISIDPGPTCMPYGEPLTEMCAYGLRVWT